MAQVPGLAAHELATKLGKDGVLSGVVGCVAVTSALKGEGDQIVLVMIWREEGAARQAAEAPQLRHESQKGGCGNVDPSRHGTGISTARADLSDGICPRSGSNQTSTADAFLPLLVD